MQCPCGGLMTASTHEVKTLAGAEGWVPTVVRSDLPLSVSINRCPGCEREHHFVQAADKRRLDRNRRR